jgi:hypothetical protein
MEADNVIWSRIDNVTDRSKIKHFVINMPAYDSRMLRKYILDNEPGMDLRCNFQCKNCGHINEIQMPMTTEFFWPTK